MLGNFINNQWSKGRGDTFTSLNPATNAILWQGNATSVGQVNQAIESAAKALPEWSNLSLDDRLIYLQRFIQHLADKRIAIEECISQETGKPLWESKAEITSTLNKLAISVEAYQNRCRTVILETSAGISVTRHKPHGVLGILGPFNFPVHLPHGHILPALLAGNTIVFKSSEHTPWLSECIFQLWAEAKLPPGVINLLQGGSKTGELLAKHAGLSGILFTGSFNTGKKLSEYYAANPGKILALEMGGNNPLVVHQIQNIPAAVLHTIQSAYLTSGQRCTCARRLIVVKGEVEMEFVEHLSRAVKNIKIGSYEDNPEPFMGPVISNDAADQIVLAYEKQLKRGAKVLVPMRRLDEKRPFLSPGLINVTEIKDLNDQEIFGPLLQLIWVDNFEQALAEANNTQYGLASGLLSDNELLYQQFLKKVCSGVVSWNVPLTGASSRAPFGGVGNSGNNRPSAYYAADYCAYPVASLEEKHLKLPKQISPGISL